MSDFEDGSDSEIQEEEHLKLLKSISQLDSNQRIKPPTRKEASLEISEFGLASVKGSNVHVRDLARTLQKQSELDERKINDAIKTQKLAINLQALPKPLEKKVAEKVKRTVGYENLKAKISRWDAVVHTNRSVRNLHFPICVNPIDQNKEADALNIWKSQKPTELEAQMNDILGNSKIVQEERKEHELIKLTLEELKEKRREMAKLRAQQSYLEAKARRQKRIKSKKYHRILRQEKMRKQLKDFEALQKTDPEAALTQLEQLEKVRAEERMTLRHKNTGHWARSRLIRAKYDPQTRQQLAEQLAISRDLTKKLKVADSSDEDQEENIPTLAKMPEDSANPWLDLKPHSEIHEFVSEYRQYWEKRNKEIEEEKLKASRTVDVEKESSDDPRVMSNPIKTRSESKEFLNETKNCELEESSNANKQSCNEIQRKTCKTSEAKGIENGETVKAKEKAQCEKPLENDDLGMKSGQNYSKYEKVLKSYSPGGVRLGKVQKKREKKAIQNLKKVKERSNASKQSSVEKATSMCEIPNEKKSENSEAEKTKEKVESKIVCETGDFSMKSRQNGAKYWKILENDRSFRVKSGKVQKKKQKETLNCISKITGTSKEWIISLSPSENSSKSSKTALVNQGSVSKLSENMGLCDTESVVEPLQSDKVSNRKKGRKRKKSKILAAFNEVESKVAEKLKEKMDRFKSLLENGNKRDVENHKLKAHNDEDLGASLAFKNTASQLTVDEELDEGIHREGSNLKQMNEVPISSVSKEFVEHGKVDDTMKTDIDPANFIKATPKLLLTSIPEHETEGDEGENEAEDLQHLTIAEAFAGDDVVDDFKKEKEDAINQSKPKDIDLSLPGWGSWAGTAIVPRKRKKRQLRIKAPPAPRRRDFNKDNVIINEEKAFKIPDHQVAELPSVFCSVRDFEASIRAPIGNTWIPQTAHKKLIRPFVTTKMGTIIKPLDEEILVNKKAHLRF